MKDLPAQEVNEVIIPLLNIARRTKTGKLNQNEPHQQQTYIGSAGMVGSFAHDKTLEIAVESCFNPKDNYVWGGSYKVPVAAGLLSESFVDDLQFSGSYDEASFSREYMSIWSSTVEGGAFDLGQMNRMRTVVRAETSAAKPTLNDDFYYILSVDVARSGSARTVMEVLKVHRSTSGFKISVVNIYLMEGKNFLRQSIAIKKLHAAFGFKTIVIDANGLGMGLVDMLMVQNVDTESRDRRQYPSFNVQNIEDYPKMRADQTPGAAPLIHIIKTNQHSAGNIHSIAYSWLFNDKVKLLISSTAAKDRLMATKKSQTMTAREKIEYLDPYKNTDLLIQETSNLAISNRIQSHLEKDTFSALEYGISVVAMQESEYISKNRTGISFSQALMMN